MNLPEHQLDALQTKLRAFIALARPHQWLKNGLTLAALVFSHRLFHARSALLAIAGFVAFCALASFGYAINDIADRVADRAHPQKRVRPIASGELTAEEAARFAAIVGAIGLAISVALGAGFAAIALFYIALQALYSVYLKRIVIIDVIAVAIGFVLRAYAGGVAIHVEVSPWLVFITFVLALFLVLARRRQELVSMGTAASSHRSALGQYSLSLLDQMISITAAAALVAYMIYSASGEVAGKLGTHRLYLTVPFVAFGILRYLYLIHARGEGGDPGALLLKDRQLMAAVILWIATDVALLYL